MAAAILPVEEGEEGDSMKDLNISAPTGSGDDDALAQEEEAEAAAVEA